MMPRPLFRCSTSLPLLMFPEKVIAMLFALFAAGAAAAAPFGAVVPLDNERLSAATAREDVNSQAVSQLTASSSSNSVSGNTQTGNASFSDNAFANVSGLTVINSNTGNNVAINGAITVNLTITPASPQ